VARALGRALVLVTILPATTVFAQNAPLRPGESYVTRFSGTVPGQNGVPVINPDGTVGSIIDVRARERPPQGDHWIDEPQRLPVTAAQVGQVFGVVLDDANPPIIAPQRDQQLAGHDHGLAGVAAAVTAARSAAKTAAGKPPAQARPADRLISPKRRARRW
jgi:hypothetical protein